MTGKALHDETDDELRTRLRDAFPVSDVPPPELYEELMAVGSWPMTLSKEDAEAYWKTRRASAKKE